MRKYITIIIAIVVLGIGFYGFKSLMNRERKPRPVPETIIQSVFVDEVVNHTFPLVISESGQLVSKNKLEVFAEVQGVMEKTGKEFKPGTTFRKGEVMVKIRNNDYYANLQAQKSALQNLITSIMPDLRLDYPEAFENWNNYLKTFDVNKRLKPLPEPKTEQEKYFISGKNIYTSFYNTKNQEIIYDKYTIRAPFTGILTEAMVNPGTVVRPGQQLGEFIDPNVYELEVAISKSFISSLQIGKKVTVSDPQNPATEWQGKVVRINGRVNPATQTVQVFIELSGKGLREGMYLSAQIQGEELDNVFEVQRNLLVQDEMLYIVRDSTLALTDVQVVHKTNNTVIVRGLENGMLVVSKAVPGTYEGMPVQINTSNE